MAATFRARAGHSACTGPWTGVYSNGFAGYPSANTQHARSILTNRIIPTRAWCNKLAQSPPSADDKATGVLRRVDVPPQRPRVRFVVRRRLEPVEPTPTVAAGYNYPNAVDSATGASTTCSTVNEYCVFDDPGRRLTAIRITTRSATVQFCSNKDAAGFGLPPCGDRWDRDDVPSTCAIGSSAATGFDPHGIHARRHHVDGLPRQRRGRREPQRPDLRAGDGEFRQVVRVLPDRGSWR